MSRDKLNGLIALAVPLGATAALIAMAALFSPFRASAAESGAFTARDQLVKGPGQGVAVYYLAADGYRYVFPNQTTYRSWFSDFSGITELTSDQLAAFPLGGNVTYRPGIRMVKITTDPKVYAVGQRGCLHWVATEQLAASLYGSDWNRQIDDLPDAFFFDYRLCEPISSVLAYQPVDQANQATSINALKSLAISPGGARISDTHPETGDAEARDCTPRADITKYGLTVSLADAGLPTESFVLFGGQEDALLGRFEFTSQNEDMRIFSASLAVEPVQPVTTLSLYDGDQRLAGPVLVNSSGQANFSGFSLVVPKDAVRRLTVRGSLKPYGQGFVESGRAIRLTWRSDLFQASAAAACSSTYIAGGSVLGERLPLEATDRIVRQTRPTVSLGSLEGQSLASAEPTVLHFAVAADPAGDLAFRRLTATVTSSSASRLTFSLPGAVLVRQSDGQPLAGQYRLNGDCSDTLAADCTLAVTLDDWQLVPAGQTFDYSLRLALAGPRTDGDWVSARLQGDLGPLTGTEAPDIAAYNFVWSDLPYESGGLIQVYGWANGAHIQGLPTADQTLSL